jgi:asparagine synthase (glutamine-hydrolysing)
MCGIAGFSGKFNSALLERMNAAISHRGPDDSGIYYDDSKGLGLAHRRLSIIDLSQLGHQPMWDVSKTVAIVFNGEIYNYKELRARLETKGYRFLSNSDTEVLLNLYLDKDTEMLRQLNGIYAFALWDTRKEELFIARDGMGVKPLYYAETAHGFIFASELKALLQCGDIDQTLNFNAIRNHLTYLYCPAPDTMLKQVKKLEPGFAIMVRHGRMTRRWQYYELPYDQPIDTAISSQDAIKQVRLHLDQAVTRQMIANVPVGAFLSGGLDSSALVALARRHGNQKMHCFTIGFKDNSFAEEGMVNDLPYARKVAQHLGVKLHTVYVGPEMADHFERMIWHLDEPQADPAPLNALFICQLARENGIKVLLSGAGGDDIFTGYRRHYALQMERYWSWLPLPARRFLASSACTLPTNTPLGRRISKAFQYADRTPDERIASYFSWIGSQGIKHLFNSDYTDEQDLHANLQPLIEALHHLPRDVPPLNRMLYLEGKSFLPDHNLNYTDKMSMACGVEVRVPFLDPDLVALAARLPLNFKQRGSQGKWILKKAMEPYLPHDVIYRSKTGFGAPLRHWLHHELKPVVHDLLSKDSLNRRGIFNPIGVNTLIADDAAGRFDGSYTIFSLMCIEMWCRIFIDQKGSLT